MIIENKEMGISFEVDNQQDFDKWYAIRKEQIRADAIEQVKPFFEILMEYDNLEWVCDELCGEFINPQTDEPWCSENCKDMNYECVKKWLELKEQK